MGACYKIKLILLVTCIYEALAIPSSMVDEIKARELRPNKVKRGSLPSQSAEENLKNSNHFYGNPTAIKRGTSLKNDGQDDVVGNDWTPEEPNVYQNTDDDFQSTLYSDGNSQDEKSFNEYEKGYQYGTNKEKLDEALENTVLKSEMYGAPSSLNQYRYFDNDKRRRRKRDSRKFNNYGNRGMADDLTPEEILSLLTLYENERQAYQKPQENQDDFEQDNDIWLDIPVRPHSELLPNGDIGAGYMFGQNPAVLDRSRWSDNRDKRFMVAKKSSDPTREIKYLTGPSKHDYYTLSQLLSNQRETNVPVFHRYIL